MLKTARNSSAGIQKQAETEGKYWPTNKQEMELVTASSSPLSSPALLGPQLQEQKSRLMQIQTHQCQ